MIWLIIALAWLAVGALAAAGLGAMLARADQPPLGPDQERLP